ncbi:MAG: hypothetical protein Q8J88_07620 [Bacteroidales bacterium]|nr:hypothetical protein [Bacteroidales bacterium]
MLIINSCKIAWRNLSRNSRRSLLTIVATFMTVFLSTTLESLHVGLWDNIVENEVRFLSGHLAIQKQGFQRHRSVEFIIEDPSEIYLLLDTMSEIEKYNSRLEFTLLAAWEDKSRPCMLSGIEPNQTFKNVHFKNDEKGVWIGKNLSQYLGVQTGDSLILLGQSMYGTNSSMMQQIIEVSQNPIPAFDRQLIIAPIDMARNFLDSEKAVSSIFLTIHNANELETIKNKILEVLPAEEFEVLSWKEMLSGRSPVFKLRSFGMMIFKGILYFILGFTLLTTFHMIVHERTHEFGLLTALGMKRKVVILIQGLEILYSSIIGIFLGSLISLSFMLIFNRYPIRITGDLAEAMIKFDNEPIIRLSHNIEILLNNIITAVIIISVVSIFPLARIMRLNITKALNN